MKNLLQFNSLLMKGMKWSSLSTLFMAVSSIIYYAVLTRYISADNFGLFSIGLVFIGFLDFFSGAGISAIIIQEKKINQQQLSTFFWINIGIGLVTWAAIWLSVPYVSAYFDNDSLSIFMYVMSGSVLMNSLSLLHHNLLRKELQLQKTEKIEMLSTAIQFVSGLYLAMAGYGFYSLPVSFLMSKIGSSVGYIILGSAYFWPSFEFRYAAVKNQMTLGSYQVLEKFFNYLRANIDKFMIGKFLGAESLGYYTLAQKLVYFPLSKINPGLNKILFPYFSKLQERPKIIAKLYQRVITFLIVLILPFLIFVLLFSEDIVSVVFDERYGQISELLRILSVLGLLKSFSNIGGNILNALGKFKVGFVWNFWWSISLTIIIYIGILLKMNIIGITYTIFFANLASFFVWHKIILHYFKFEYKYLLFNFLKFSILYIIIVYLLLLSYQLFFQPFSISIILLFYTAILSIIVLFVFLSYFNISSRFIQKFWK
ncbi:MAG: oligosaccharide flippase family protein [Saprospiraceae bacterium]